jgi:hypothetical protein
MIRVKIIILLLSCICQAFGQTADSNVKKYYFNTNEDIVIYNAVEGLDSVNYQYKSKTGEIRIPYQDYNSFQNIDKQETIDQFYKAIILLDYQLAQPAHEKFSIYYLGDVLIQKGITTKLFLILCGEELSEPSYKVVLALNFYQGTVTSIIDLAESRLDFAFGTILFHPQKQ